MGTRGLRSLHRARIFETLRKNPGFSRAELARELALSPSTVTEVVEEFLDEGLLVERPLPPKGQGRPSVALEVEGKRNLVLGWEIDIDRMGVSLMNFHGEVIRKTILPPAPGTPEAALAVLAEATAPLLKEARIRAAGVSIPGLVEPEEGHLTLAPNLGWQNIPLRDQVRERLLELGVPSEAPLVVENEANAAAYGLYALGNWPVENCAYLNLGVGVGGGLVLGHRVYRGERFHAGEVGHITLDPQGPRCRCGKQGCAEVFLSYRRWQEDPSETLFDEMAERLAQLSALILAVLDPGLVVLGGPLMQALGARLLQAVRDRLPRYALPVHTPDQVALSPLGRDAALLGAAALAADRFVVQMAFVEAV